MVQSFLNRIQAEWAQREGPEKYRRWCICGLVHPGRKRSIFLHPAKVLVARVDLIGRKLARLHRYCNASQRCFCWWREIIHICRSGTTDIQVAEVCGIGTHCGQGGEVDGYLVCRLCQSNHGRKLFAESGFRRCSLIPLGHDQLTLNHEHGSPLRSFLAR